VGEAIHRRLNPDLCSRSLQTLRRCRRALLLRDILNPYLYHPECKFTGPDGNLCPWTRSILQRRHIVAGSFSYCGKEFKRKHEQVTVDHQDKS
jgi:hypothetical protein